jgi:hypothetical protein
MSCYMVPQRDAHRDCLRGITAGCGASSTDFLGGTSCLKIIELVSSKGNCCLIARDEPTEQCEMPVWVSLTGNYSSNHHASCGNDRCRGVTSNSTVIDICCYRQHAVLKSAWHVARCLVTGHTQIAVISAPCSISACSYKKLHIVKAYFTIAVLY